jgi:hypothetical protein
MCVSRAQGNFCLPALRWHTRYSRPQSVRATSFRPLIRAEDPQSVIPSPHAVVPHGKRSFARLCESRSCSY